MIKIKSLDFRTIEIPDLGDRIFFGQTKLFTEQQVASSKDLKAAVDKGRVSILSDLDGYPTYKEPPAPIVPPIPVKVVEQQPPPPQVDLELSQLRDKLSEVTEKLERATTTPEPPPQNDVLERLVTTVGDMQKALAAQSTDTVKAVQESTTRLEKSLSGISASGPGVSRVITHTDRGPKEEVFIPSLLSVTDMTNNIQLQTKVVGQGDAVRNSVNKLKDLKKGSQPK
jgi:hypothetical protein